MGEERQKARVVIDTNVFVSSFFVGVPRKVIELWLDGVFILCLSGEILEEYVDVLERLGVEGEELRRLLKVFSSRHNILFTTRTPDLAVVMEDPSDDKFIECAVALDCQYIVSGDKHLKGIVRYMGISILNPSDFLRLMVEERALRVTSRSHRVLPERKIHCFLPSLPVWRSKIAKFKTRPLSRVFDP